MLSFNTSANMLFDLLVDVFHQQTGFRLAVTGHNSFGCYSQKICPVTSPRQSPHPKWSSHMMYPGWVGSSLCRPYEVCSPLTRMSAAECSAAINGMLACLPQVTGVQNPGCVVSVMVRGSNKLVIEEADRSIHDALCVIRCLVKKRWAYRGVHAAQWSLYPVAKYIRLDICLP